MNERPRTLRPTKVVTATHVSVVVMMVAAIAVLGLGTLAFLNWVQR